MFRNLALQIILDPLVEVGSPGVVSSDAGVAVAIGTGRSSCHYTGTT